MSKIFGALAVIGIALAVMAFHPNPTAADQQTVGLLIGVAITLAALGAPAYLGLTRRLLRDARRMEDAARIMRALAGAKAEHRRQ